MNAIRRYSPLMLCLALAACSPSHESNTPATKAAMVITTEPVKTQKLSQSIEAQGAIVPWQEAIISAKVGGLTLTELNAEIGDQVKKGQVLARFDNRTVQAELAQAKASLAQANANLAQAMANRDREQQLERKKFVSDQAVQLAHTNVAVAEAQQQMAQAQVAAQEIRLKDCDVVAVDDGVISARSVTLGQTAQGIQGGTELFRLIRQNKLEWRPEIPQLQLSKVELGQNVTLQLPNGGTARGKVRQIAPALSTNRLGMAFVDLEANNAIRSGMYVSGRIKLAEKEALVVPVESVVLRDGHGSVFRLNKDNTVTQILVETGMLSDNLIEISQGLNNGEAIAVKGAGFLADGDHVKEKKPASLADSNGEIDPLNGPETVAKGGK